MPHRSEAQACADYSQSVGSFDHVLTGETLWFARTLDDRLYTINGDSLQIYAIADPVAPVLVGSTRVSSPLGLGGLAAAGSIALVLRDDWLPSVAVIDVSDLASPESVATLKWGLDGRYVLTTNGVLAALGRDAGVQEGGVRLWDVTQPSQPVDLGPVGPSSPVSALTFVDHYLIVAYGSTDTRVFDLSVEGFPQVADIALTGAARDFRLVGSSLYAAESSSEYSALARNALEVIDLTSPASPTIVGKLLLPDGPRGPTIDVADDVAYVADGVTTFWVCDVHDAQAPALIGQAGAFLDCTTAFVAGDAVCFAGGTDGVFLFPQQCTVPTSSGSVGASYGPAKLAPHGNGRVRLSLSRASDVTIAVYDPPGRRVHAVATTLDAGPHVIHWDRPAAPLPSGLYFLRVTAGGDAYTIRAPLLR